ISPQQADLIITKTVDNAAPNVGGTVTFTVTVSNAGPNAAGSVAVTDLLPAGLTLGTATPSQGSYASGTGVWTVGTVNNGSTATITISATVASAGVKTNTATITAVDQFDPASGNNSASATVTPQQADLSLAKTVDV